MNHLRVGINKADRPGTHHADGQHSIDYPDRDDLGCRVRTEQGHLEPYVGTGEPHVGTGRPHVGTGEPRVGLGKSRIAYGRVVRGIPRSRTLAAFSVR